MAGEEALNGIDEYINTQRPMLMRGSGLIAHLLEHFEAGNGNTFRATVDAAVLGALETPFGAGAGVEQDADEKQIEQSTASFIVVNCIRQGGQKLGDAITTADAKVLVSAMARDVVERGIIIALPMGKKKGQSIATERKKKKSPRHPPA